MTPKFNTVVTNTITKESKNYRHIIQSNKNQGDYVKRNWHSVNLSGAGIQEKILKETDTISVPKETPPALKYWVKEQVWVSV